MRGRKSALRIDLTPEERTELERRVRCTTLPAGAVRRARIILGVASGLHLIEVARRVGITEKHVRKWTIRFNEKRLEGLKDRPGRGRKPVFSPDSRDARRQNRMRTARSNGQVAVAVGLP
ncbi:MAG: helix-turn-helix domain-containing protein [Planctomycetota bacterium]|nr:helix-turn-helix domain-containing protein [Planctomycetota bacterium]RLS26352.1 MAG: helix-turn-helix domain-containing protein [Planctomycetota bacterium]